jgi:hypothetical protein
MLEGFQGRARRGCYNKPKIEVNLRELAPFIYSFDQLSSPCHIFLGQVRQVACAVRSTEIRVRNLGKAPLFLFGISLNSGWPTLNEVTYWAAVALTTISCGVIRRYDRCKWCAM